jgi:hypothetical protein
MQCRKHRTLRPTLEPMERRELPSGIMATLPGRLDAARAAAGQAQVILPSNVPYQGKLPTPAELSLERFRAVFSGNFATGKPLFFDQTSRTVIHAIGGSNLFLHGNLQFLTVTPTDPNSPLAGTATLQDKNLNTSGILTVDLTGSQTDVDSAGRPTHLSFSMSPFAGSGSFTAGVFSLATGQGTVDIRYRPSGKRGAPGVTSQGDVTILFRGSIYTTGTVNPLANSTLQASHDRPAPF